jgi:hypothetical protein
LTSIESRSFYPVPRQRPPIPIISNSAAEPIYRRDGASLNMRRFYQNRHTDAESSHCEKKHSDRELPATPSRLGADIDLIVNHAASIRGEPTCCKVYGFFSKTM